MYCSLYLGSLIVFLPLHTLFFCLLVPLLPLSSPSPLPLSSPSLCLLNLFLCWLFLLISPHLPPIFCLLLPLQAYPFSSFLISSSSAFSLLRSVLFLPALPTPFSLPSYSSLFTGLRNMRWFRHRLTSQECEMLILRLQ